MRFTVVATGQFSLRRAFGFGLAASSLTQLSVVNSLIRPAGLAPAWPPASPAHTGPMQLNWGPHAPRVRCSAPSRNTGRRPHVSPFSDWRKSHSDWRRRQSEHARARVLPDSDCTVPACAGEAGCHAGASPAGRIRLFTTESCVREEAARPNPKARRRLNCPVVTTVNLIQ